MAALRFLTEALFASLHHHGRVSADGDRAVVQLLAGAPASASTPEERLGQELLPCRPDDALFEPRLKAILRRHVVERCIYGVDLDPLAVELCRLALWIETMDRTLPFSFLDHKVKCGNAHPYRDHLRESIAESSNREPPAPHASGQESMSSGHSKIHDPKILQM